MQNETEIFTVTLGDIPKMVDLSRLKRLEYEKVHPTFWKYAGEQGDQSQRVWFEALLEKNDTILLKAVYKNELQGFIIGQLIKAPSVYAPGGLTLMVDDFCVSEPKLWDTIGIALLQTLRDMARVRGAIQAVIACGCHDTPKKEMLKDIAYFPVTEWYVG